MRTKDQSTEMLEHYLRWITKQNRVTRFMRCDSDPIFKGYEYKAMAESFNVDLSYSAPYTPTQNTMAERRWGMVGPAARAMLHTACLPASYWEFAILCACYLNNRSYHSGPDGIPLTLVTGHIPNLANLRIFGCPAYVHIPSGQRLKMANTAFKGIFIGYPTYTYGFLTRNQKHLRKPTTSNPDESGVLEPKTLKTAIKGHFLPVWARV
jgi:hypothetical protein